MLKEYIYWSIFALVVLGVVVSVVRGRSQRRSDAASEAESFAAIAPVSQPAKEPSSDDDFDPSATRIHLRAAPARESPSSSQRVEVSLENAGSVRLVCVGGAHKGNSFSVSVAGLTVGRDQQNDIVIADPRVSTRHAWVGIIEGKAVLRDLGSTNGTFLNARMDTLVSEVVLRPGDTIFFGGHAGEQYRLVVD